MRHEVEVDEDADSDGAADMEYDRKAPGAIAVAAQLPPPPPPALQAPAASATRCGSCPARRGGGSCGVAQAAALAGEPDEPAVRRGAPLHKHNPSY